MVYVGLQVHNIVLQAGDTAVLESVQVMILRAFLRFRPLQKKHQDNKGHIDWSRKEQLNGH